MPHRSRRKLQKAFAYGAVLGSVATFGFAAILLVEAPVLDMAGAVRGMVPFLLSLAVTTCMTVAAVTVRANEALTNGLAASLLLRQVVSDAENETRPALRVVDR